VTNQGILFTKKQGLLFAVYRIFMDGVHPMHKLVQIWLDVYYPYFSESLVKSGY